jgi:peptidoglycan/LPS O-acetylase OafA/YrhL
MRVSLIRILAVGLIYLHHHPVSFFVNPKVDWQKELHFGVSIFFVLSGFLLGKYAENEDFFTAKALSEYALKRILRIFPLYWLVLLATVFLRKETDFESFILNFFLLHGLIDKPEMWYIESTWSLTTEIFFYALLPFLALIWRKTGLLSLILVLLLSAVLNILCGAFYGLIFFAGRLPDFFIGLIFYLNRKKISEQISRIGGGDKTAVWAAFLGLFSILLFNISAQKGGELGVLLLPNRLIYCLLQGFFIAVLLLIFCRTDLNSNAGRFAGAATYPFFLLHQGLMQNFFWEIFPSRIVNLCLLILISLLLTWFEQKIIALRGEKVKR